MSTTFEVFPYSSRLPSFADVIGAARARLSSFLSDFGIDAKPEITVSLKDKTTDEDQPLSLGGPMKWAADYYAWFRIPRILGGTDVYVFDTESFDIELWDELFDRNQKAAELRNVIQRSLQQGYRWSFRRSMGQPAIINVMYGLLAATTAELTEGVIYSNDRAWDYQRFPAKPDDFLKWYFRPAQALDPHSKEWVERCIRQIPDELGMSQRGAS